MTDTTAHTITSTKTCAKVENHIAFSSNAERCSQSIEDHPEKFLARGWHDDESIQGEEKNGALTYEKDHTASGSTRTLNKKRESLSEISIKSSDSVYFTPSTSLHQMDIITVQIAETEDRGNSVQDASSELLRGSIAKLQDEIQSLKSQQSMREKRDKHMKEQITKLGEVLFQQLEHICDLESENLQLKHQIEKVEAVQNAQMSEFVRNLVLNRFDSFRSAEYASQQHFDDTHTYTQCQRSRSGEY